MTKQVEMRTFELNAIFVLKKWILKVAENGCIPPLRKCIDTHCTYRRAGGFCVPGIQKAAQF